TGLETRYMKTLFRYKLALLLAATLPVVGCTMPVPAAPQYTFENLGKPVRLPLPIEFVTTDAQQRSIAWGSLVDDERRALVGVRLDGGELVTVDLSKYGKSNANLFFKHDENMIFIYSGNPGRFFKY